MTRNPNKRASGLIRLKYMADRGVRVKKSRFKQKAAPETSGLDAGEPVLSLSTILGRY